MSDPIKHWMVAHPYKTAVRFVKSAAELAWCRERFKDYGNEWALDYACCWDDEKGGGHTVFIYLSPAARNKTRLQGIKAVTHECAHAAFMIAKRHAWEPGDSRGEQFCHLLDWLVGEAIKYYGIKI